MGNEIVKGALYLVATPIGNLGDLSPRAKHILESVDFVAAEDTRVSGKLLSCFSISKPMISYYEHNKEKRREQLLRRLAAGESCALVTDAGMPAISDPGADMVKLCAQAGILVFAVPGPCAAVAALALSGLDTTRFVFEGFLPEEKKIRKARLEEIALEKRTVILYVSPHDLKKVLDEVYAATGNRQIALARELTKRNEEVLRITLEQAIAYYTENDPRGEYVLVMEGIPEGNAQSFWSQMEIAAHVKFYVEQGMSRMDAMKAVARDRVVSKNTVYQAILDEKQIK
ncbi:MAG TPA: 16S rRNA (cytidine(1402)-2'-O)-methyltransferase [Clostridiales bacterium]|jgi:16S rRNA (cytidine1402-2'-O)-methyltransferase|nr:16S rRNA (cytidine(1402)-2'-O)-methyltransferase [Clostridiales bacterium]